MELTCLSVRNTFVPIRVIFTYIRFFFRKTRTKILLSALQTLHFLVTGAHFCIIFSILIQELWNFLAVSIFRNKLRVGPLYKLRTESEKIPLQIPINNQLDAKVLYIYIYIYLYLFIYFDSLHVSSNLVLIIRRVNCINKTCDTCHFVRVTVRYAGPELHTGRSPT